MTAAIWRRVHRRAIYRLRQDDRCSLYNMGAAEWWLEIGGPPAWPWVDLAQARRLSCGGLRFRFATRAEALRFAAAYLALHALPTGAQKGAHGDHGSL